MSPRVRLTREPAVHALRRLQAGSIDVLITDPPYATVDRHSSTGSHLRRWFRGSQSWVEIGRVLRLARSRMAVDGIAFVMTNQAGLEGALQAVRGAGFVEPIRVITWDRRAPGLGSGLRHQVEYIVVGRLPGSRALTGSDLISIASLGPNTANRYPTQKPDDLGRALAKVARVRRTDTVVDPFCGAGGLLVGAAARAIGLAGSRLQTAARTRAPTSLEGRRGRAEPASRKSARRPPNGAKQAKPKAKP